MQLRDRSYRNEMKVIDEIGRRFLVFMRVNEFFEECFSVGLTYLPVSGKSITLLRCNGPHGGHEKMKTETKAHYHYHIHRATIEMIEQNRQPEKDAVVTTAYNCFKQALRYFLKEANIEWGDPHFPGLNQPSLFDGIGDES